MSIQFYFDSSMSVIKSIHRKYGKRLYGTQNFLNVYFSYTYSLFPLLPRLYECLKKSFKD